MTENQTALPLRIEIQYYDKLGKPTGKDNAVKIILTEYDKNGNIIRSLLSAKSQT